MERYYKSPLLLIKSVCNLVTVPETLESECAGPAGSAWIVGTAGTVGTAVSPEEGEELGMLLPRTAVRSS